MSAVKFIPEGYSTVTPYLVVKDTMGLLKFMQEAFGAKVHYRMDDPSGAPMHAELQVGSSRIMMGKWREGVSEMPACLYLYVEDCDAVFAKAVTAGAEVVQGVSTQFYGDRHGGVKDAFGNQWWIATHVEDVSSEELTRRAKAAAH
jgi:PhnB protein